MNVIDWLLDSDPAIRWQVMRDLTDAPADEVAAERARVAREGWGAAAARRAARRRPLGRRRVLPRSGPRRRSACSCCARFGVDPSERAGAAGDRARSAPTCTLGVRRACRYFDGEVEPCINGQAVAIGAYFGQDVRGIVDRLLAEQMADGGWNCEQENGSTRGSFDTTINVLEGLLEYERATGGERRRWRRPASAGRSTCSSGGCCAACRTARSRRPRWLYFAFPNGWHYDVAARARLPARCRRRAGRANGRGASTSSSRSATPTAAGRSTSPTTTSCSWTSASAEGEPSRWITLRALRVLRWAGRSEPALSSSSASA